MKDRIYVNRIQTYCKHIISYTEDIQTEKEWTNNQLKVDAVLFNLEQIGETAKKISTITKNKFPDIHWLSIIGLRNLISHQYEGVKLHFIYEIVTKDIPVLLKSLCEGMPDQP